MNRFHLKRDFCRRSIVGWHTGAEFVWFVDQNYYLNYFCCFCNLYNDFDGPVDSSTASGFRWPGPRVYDFSIFSSIITGSRRFPFQFRHRFAIRSVHLSRRVVGRIHDVYRPEGVMLSARRHARFSYYFTSYRIQRASLPTRTVRANNLRIMCAFRTTKLI